MISNIQEIIELKKQNPKLIQQGFSPNYDVDYEYELAPKYKQENYNMRSQFEDEIIVDADEKGLFESVKNQLINDGYYFSMWKTNGKNIDGYHFHLFFPKLKNYSEETKKLIREKFIFHYNGDLALKSNKVAVEGRPHHKTRNLKELTYQNGSDEEVYVKGNDLPNWIIDNLSEEIKKAKTTTKGNLVICPFHNDHEPSMSVDIEKGICYCHGCQCSATYEAYLLKNKGEESKISEKNTKKGKKHYFVRKPKAFNIVNSYENVEKFYEEQPFFYDKYRMFWFWNLESNCYEIVDEIDLMNMIEESLSLKGLLSSSKEKAEYLENFKKIGRLNIPTEAPKKWIQFKDKAFSIESNNIYGVKSNYFFTNPIPWEIGDKPFTPVMDRLFSEWVGEKYVQTLYEIISYCCYSSYPIHSLFCFIGSGRNGKSQFLKILDKFIGDRNSSTAELDMLANPNNRFESFKLYKKLVCLIGETNFGVLSSSGLIKKLTGGDRIGFEKKNKDPFDDYNYAKMIIATNSLPSSQDTSDGFYRRWLIIDFPNEFEDTGREVWKEVPDEEYESLAKKVTLILPELLERGIFTNQGSIAERKKSYIQASNPLSLFIQDHCLVDFEKFESYSKLYTNYVHYLLANKRRKVTRKEFKSCLEDEGFYVEKCSKNINGVWKNTYWVEGIQVKV